MLILSMRLFSVADPHHLDADPDADPDPACDAGPGPVCHLSADPDLTFHFDADPDPSIQIKGQNPEKMLKQGQISYILACHLQIDADPDSVYHFDADPDPHEIEREDNTSFLFSITNVAYTEHVCIELMLLSLE